MSFTRPGPQHYNNLRGTSINAFRPSPGKFWLTRFLFREADLVEILGRFFFA